MSAHKDTLVSLPTSDLAIYIADVCRMIGDIPGTTPRKAYLLRQIGPLQREMDARIDAAVAFLEGSEE